MPNCRSYDSPRGIHPQRKEQKNVAYAMERTVTEIYDIEKGNTVRVSEFYSESSVRAGYYNNASHRGVQKPRNFLYSNNYRNRNYFRNNYNKNFNYSYDAYRNRNVNYNNYGESWR